MINKSMFTSLSDDWATPKKLFDELNREFNFTLDPCASEKNAKCPKYYTIKDNGLLQDRTGERVFCNPPYGRNIKLWIEKAYKENKKGAFVVLLIPARTDTAYFHDYIYNKHEIRFLKGRLHFNDGKSPAPFPSMIVIMR